MNVTLFRKHTLRSLIALLFTYTQFTCLYSQTSKSPTEGVIDSQFVEEEKMQQDLLQMLADFTIYIKNDYQECETSNILGEKCGCFKGENTMGSNEQGVRPNADLSMICAFLCKYGKGNVNLPSEVSWESLQEMAKGSLVYAYSTHKANELLKCKDGRCWGSIDKNSYVWESSLWAMSVAFSAFFQWGTLSDTQKSHIEKLLKAECNYELQRTIPTGYIGDTKSEENGWETNVLAVTLGLFPNDSLSYKWYDRLRAFAINSYSHPNDKENKNIIDEWYDNTTIADLFVGANLYSDYTLQNHNYFHTSYQNVVMQELGESALALQLFQTILYGKDKWKTNALMHNNKKVMEEVLNHLALADGELAMPNGNDWSLFLYDQITSYSTMACFLRSPDALMLENLAYKHIKARQTTTKDGAWLLRADVGARRMGVEAHRVMMTWLMHHIASTKDIVPTPWEEFRKNNSKAKHFTSQDIICASTKDRFTCFSWSEGLKSYTGYIAANTPDRNKIILPFKRNNTGNFLGWFTVKDKHTNAILATKATVTTQGESYTLNGENTTNDGALNHRYSIFSTPGNAVFYLDDVMTNYPCTIQKEEGGVMAISADDFTSVQRTIFYDNNQSFTSDGGTPYVFTSEWANIDNEIGIISKGNNNMRFADRFNNNSIMSAIFSPCYSDSLKSFSAFETIARRNITYYSGIDVLTTKRLYENYISLSPVLPIGWNGILASDPDKTRYFFITNFRGQQSTTINNLSDNYGAPVFAETTIIENNKSNIPITLPQNSSYSGKIVCYVKAKKIVVNLLLDKNAIIISNETNKKQSITLTTITPNGKINTNKFHISKQETKTILLD